MYLVQTAGSAKQKSHHDVQPRTRIGLRLIRRYRVTPAVADLLGECAGFGVEVR